MIRNSILNRFSDFSDSKILNGFVFSKIESSLAVKGVWSTSAQIEKLHQAEDGQLLNRSHEIALKYVLAIPVTGDGYFDWKDYNHFSQDDFSKAYYVRV